MLKKCLLALLMVIVLHGNALVAFAQKIYVFSEGDVHDQSVGRSVVAGTSLVRDLFNLHMPEDRLVIYNQNSYGGSWTGPNISTSYNVKSDILRAIRNCPAGPSDTIFFYWCGHGAFDQGGHFLWMPQNRGDRAMYRSEILNALKAKNVRLVVLMTESCHVYQNFPRPVGDAPGSAPNSGVPAIFKSLFFDYRGVVDFNTSSPGQTSKAYPDGGFYTLCFLLYLDENTDRSVSWKTLLNDLDFKVRGHQQKAYVWSLPSGSNHGNEFRSNEWSAPSYHPESGDRIIFVNETQIRDEAHFREVIRNADTRIVLTLIDNRTGNRYYMMTNLLPRNSTTRLGIYVQDDYRGGVKVTRIMPGTPGTRCSFLKNGDVQSVRSSSEVY